MKMKIRKRSKDGKLAEDSYGRIIDYLRISITDRCNLRCVYCMPEEGIKLFPHNEILTYEEIIFLTKLLAKLGIKKVRITGGEPLIRKNLTYLIEKINNIEGINDIAITTNGILLSDMAKDLKNAGLKRVNISLDSLRKDRFFQITRKDDFNKVIDGIYKSVEIGLKPVKINVVVMRSVNDDEIIDFINFVKDKEIEIRFIEFMPWGKREKWSKEKVVTTDEIMRAIEKEFGSLVPIPNKTNGPAVNYKITGINGTVGFINPISSHFCKFCNRIRLTADGKIRLCLFSEKEIDVKKLIRQGLNENNLMKFLRETILIKPKEIDISSHLTRKSREMSQIGG